MDEYRSPNDGQAPRFMLAFAVFITLFVGAIGVFLIPIAEGGINMPEIDLETGTLLRYLGYFLVVDGLVSFFGGAIYLANKFPRVLDSPEAAALQERIRANLSLQATQEAEQGLRSLQKKVWQRGLVFISVGLVSLIAAAALLSGLLG